MNVKIGFAKNSFDGQIFLNPRKSCLFRLDGCAALFLFCLCLCGVTKKSHKKRYVLAESFALFVPHLLVIRITPNGYRMSDKILAGCQSVFENNWPDILLAGPIKN